MERNIIGVANALLTSRKFWVASISAIASAYLYIRGAIDADTLADVFVVLGGVLVSAIALEDAAEKRGGGNAENAVIELRTSDDDEIPPAGWIE